MYTRIVSLLLAAALLGGPALAGQQRGQKPSSPQAKGRPATVAQGGQRQGGSQKGSIDRQRARIQVSQQQRDRLTECTQANSRIRQQARQLAQAGKGRDFDIAQARRQRDQLRTHSTQMLRQHERFMQGLDDAQRRQLQDRIRKMDQSRDRLQSCLQAIDQELDAESPNPKSVRKQARLLEKESKRFEKHYRKLDGQIAVLP